MGYVDWNDCYSVGDDKIDDQHKLFLKYINDYHSSMILCKADVHETLKRLINYAKNHFEYEKMLMEKIGYPDSNQHNEKHDLVLNKLLEMQTKQYKNDVEKCKDLFDVVIKDWLLNHILTDDNKLGRFIKNK